MAGKKNPDVRALKRFDEKVKRLEILFQESDFRFFLPNWPLSRDVDWTFGPFTQEILYCSHVGFLFQDRPVRNRPGPKGLMVLEKKQQRMAWILGPYDVKVEFFGRTSSKPYAFRKVLKAVGLRQTHVLDAVVSSRYPYPEARLACLLNFIQVVETLQAMLVARIVGECRQERLRIEARFGSVQEAIEKSLHPFFLLRDYLIPRLQRYVGKTRSHRAIIKEAREAFGILVPYLVADQLGKGSEGGQNG